MELTKEEIELIEKKRIKEAKKKKEQESSVISKEEKDYLFNLYNSEEKPLDYEGFCKYLDNKDYTRRNWIKLFIEYKKGVSIEELANRRGRISKLAIWKNEEFDGVVEGLRTAPLLFNYDRGYDIQAENQDVADVREIIIKEYN